MDKTLLIDHVSECLRNNLGCFLEIDALFVHFSNICGWNAPFKRHCKDTLCCIISINFWYSNILIVLKYGGTLLCIISLQLEIKLLWKTSLEFFRQPAILEVWEYPHGAVGSELDKTEIAWHLLLNPHMLNFNCNNLSCRSQTSLVYLS